MEHALSKFQTRLYVSQIERQCDYAFEALNLINFKLNHDASNQSENLNTEMYFLATNFVISVANIHKLVVGSGTNPRRSEAQNAFTKQRILFLKEHFGALMKKLPNRSFRNSLEHFDERLDDAMLESGILIDHNIMIVDKYDDHKKLIVVPNAKVLRKLVIVRTSRKFYFEFSKDKICLNDVELVLKEIKLKCKEF